MKDYLGETIIDIDKSKFKNYTIIDWAKFWIEERGQYDGEHHKAAVLDGVMQILHGTPIIIRLAKWKYGKEEYRFSLGKKSKSYLKFIDEYEEGGEYYWYTGIDS